MSIHAAAAANDTNRIIDGGEAEAQDGVMRRAQAIVAAQMGIDESRVTEDTRFLEDLNADSLDKAALVMELEVRFDVEVSDDDIKGFKTIGDVVRYVEGAV